MKIIILLLICGTILENCGVCGVRMGGMSKRHDKDPVAAELVEELQERIEEKAGRKYTTFSLEGVRTQVVAGTNYFLQIKVGFDQYIHVRVFVPLPMTPKQPNQVVAIKTDQNASDLLTYF